MRAPIGRTRLGRGGWALAAGAASAGGWTWCWGSGTHAHAHTFAHNICNKYARVETMRLAYITREVEYLKGDLVGAFEEALATVAA